MKTILITLLFACVSYAARASDGVEIRAFYVTKDGAIAAMQGKDINGSLLSSGPDAFIVIQTRNHTGRPASGIIAVRVTLDKDAILVPVPSVSAQAKDWITTVISTGSIVFPKGNRQPEIRWEKFDQE